MKKLLPFLVITLIITYGCTKEEMNQFPAEQDASMELSDLKSKAYSLHEEELTTAFNNLLVSNEARLAGSNSRASCDKSAHVPNEYPTIQAAIDAACAGGNVIVHPGTYSEELVVITPGLHIKAVGEVTLIGNFVLAPNTNNVKIQKFNIITNPFDPELGNFIETIGIYVNESDGGQLKQNTITASRYGIYLRRASGWDVKNNNISGDGGPYAEFGILVGSALEDENNKISQNTLTGFVFGITLGGNMDNNVLNGNTASSCLFGISLLVLDGAPDNNVLKNNVLTGNSQRGLLMSYFALDDGGTNNTIGPNNTFNSNGLFGIFVDQGFLDNLFFNNTALENAGCDIIDSNGPEVNTFTNNTYECAIGL